MEEPLGGYQTTDAMQEPNSDNQEEVEQKEHKFSPGVIGIIILAIFAVAILLLTLLSRLSLQKQDEGISGETVQPQKVVEAAKGEDDSNALVTEAESYLNSTDSDGSKSSSDESGKSQENSVSQESVGTLNVQEADPTQEVASPAEDSSVQEVSNDPSLGEELQASVIVSAKNIYMLDNSSYAYSLTLLMLSNNETEEYTTMKYFCSRKTFDNVAKGDTLTMSYQLDTNGIISPSGIAK